MDAFLKDMQISYCLLATHYTIPLPPQVARWHIECVLVHLCFSSERTWSLCLIMLKGYFKMLDGKCIIFCLLLKFLYNSAQKWFNHIWISTKRLQRWLKMLFKHILLIWLKAFVSMVKLLLESYVIFIWFFLYLILQCRACEECRVEGKWGAVLYVFARSKEWFFFFKALVFSLTPRSLLHNKYNTSSSSHNACVRHSCNRLLAVRMNHEIGEIWDNQKYFIYLFVCLF